LYEEGGVDCRRDGAGCTGDQGAHDPDEEHR
jgi:hypothetical protein